MTSPHLDNSSPQIPSSEISYAISYAFSTMSYTNGSGGTLTLPSPTHVHHVDVTSAVRSLRRSLSRSPSKFRLVTQPSPSSSPKSPLSPSPSSPSKKSYSHSTTPLSGTPAHTPSPLAKPFPPSVKLSLRSASRKSTPAPPRATSKTRTSPRSPLKRALTVSSDSANSAPSLSSEFGSGQENRKSGSLSPTERRSLEKQRNMSFHVEVTAPINHVLSRLGDGTHENGLSHSNTASPLKRSDAIMNLDQASLGSPVAKRRSLHGSASFGHDFNVFDHGPATSPQFDIHDDSNQEYELSATSVSTGNSSISSVFNMPRRSSSLRKSTLQQRTDKSSWGRRHAANELASSVESITPVASKTRPRLSLDQFMPPMSRDSPFSAQGSLPSASLHLMNQLSHQPHPLSRTMTSSSSGSSLVDESPTHIPPHFGEQPRPKLDFSKSLPPGALRPIVLDGVNGEDSGSFATPDHFRSAKPLPAAFMSTGLISKVNRNPEEQPLLRGVGKGIMPDTPCKKSLNGFATVPAHVPGSAIAKARHIRHSFGTPSTPFNLHGTKPPQGTFGKGAGVFGSGFGNKVLTRRSSFLSVDGDDTSPDATGDSQLSDIYDLPPTPTKQAPMLSSHDQQPSNGTTGAYSLRNVPPSTSAVGQRVSHIRTSSKLNILTTSGDKDAEDSDASIDLNGSPTASTPRLPDALSLPSSTRSRSRRSSQTILVAKSISAPFLTPSRKPGFAKISHVPPASPLERIDFIERLSPHTPHESMLPPDPSGLSISNHKHTQLQKQASSSASMPPPATPTTGRDYFTQFGDRRLSITPINGFVSVEVDDVLTSRFNNVELIGTGEFSQVYRVTQPSQIQRPAHSFYIGSPSTTSRASATPLPDRVFAVKKSRQPYQGTRDRQRKLQEVNVLRALGHSDHVVHLIESWEVKDYLYIQTEFCEEGPLDLFLSTVGRRGRLDDFRIWKIMFELSQGLKHIHDSGFIHLDLKPANILITFEGGLKIADFGMAASWPAQPGIDGEGDREYIGPEILLGQYDKPADVFALGLIMLEIAGNVQLPDNGPTWQRLRSGDMSDVPSLTWSTASTIHRDAIGIPLEESSHGMNLLGSDDEIDTEFGSPTMTSRKRHSVPPPKFSSHNAGNLFGSLRQGELRHAPSFMRDQFHKQALDRIVRWMISPQPEDRPQVHQILEIESVRWIAARARSGATVYEGNWGPADDVLADDAEMIDV